MARVRRRKKQRSLRPQLNIKHAIASPDDSDENDDDDDDAGGADDDESDDCAAPPMKAMKRAPPMKAMKAVKEPSPMKVMKKPAAAPTAAPCTDRPSLAYTPTEYNGGRIFYSQTKTKFGCFRCYVRKTDRVEKNMAIQSSGTRAAKACWGKCLDAIDVDPRPRAAE